MNVEALELVFIGFSIAVLFLLSLVETALTQSGQLALRMVLERRDGPATPLMELVLEDPMQVLMPLHVGMQLATITIAVLTAHLCLDSWGGWGVAYSFAAVIAASLVFRQFLPRLCTQNDPERKALRLLRLYNPLHVVLSSVTHPLSHVLRRFERVEETASAGSEPAAEQTGGEEFQAYLDIGEDEGIIKEDDSKLIQSVVEFGETLAREVMTPRTEIIACDEQATIGQLREIMVRHRHSRIPIYSGDFDHIVGIAHIRQLLAAYTPGRESDPVTGVMHPALFIPETKPVSSLLKEMQQRGDQATIVIDEFGGVSGIVTMEDLLEEIVGEIRDEDQAAVTEIAEEGPSKYIFKGSAELDRLRDLTGTRFDGYDCSTVAGMVVAFLGRVPAPGEEFDIEDIRFRILDADRKRVRRIRVSLPATPPPKDSPGVRGGT
jgi:putative hemolysin